MDEHDEYEARLQEADLKREQIKETIALMALVTFSLVIAIGVIGWIFTGDFHKLIRTVIIFAAGVAITVYITHRITYVAEPTLPLPDHPDMIPNEED